MMKRSLKVLWVLLGTTLLCGLTTACNDAEELEREDQKDEEVDGYNYSEKGFFMNGETKVVGGFERDSIMTGYAKYVKRCANYRTKDGVEHDIILGYGLVVELDNYAKFYSDDITYNTDSTLLNCNGEFMLLSNENTHPATIEARVDSIGKPHLITCRTTVNGKIIKLQFRQTYHKSQYSNAELPAPDDFDI